MLLLCLLPAIAMADAETLRLLNYNVRNLPDQVAPFDDRAPRIQAIAEQFDVIVLQEDFAPDGLYNRWDGPVFRGPEARWRWYYVLSPVFRLMGYAVPYDSGLTLMLPDRYEQAGARGILLTDVAFESCYGVFRHSHDCWANKGLLGVRVTTPSGAEVDVYTTHLDAGGAPPNQAVRAEQLEVVRAAIESHSDGRAVILAGDFNTPQRRPDDFAALAATTTALGLSDAGARHAHPDGGPCQVDFVFYRDGADTTLEVLEAYEPAATTPGAEAVDFCGGPWRGLALSDHPALAVTFRIE